MSDLPAPLTPADCDLRGYDFMPLFGHRLFGSDLYDRMDDAEFRIAIRLWWEAWNQCPAGSLPSDDRRLCKLAELGRDMKAWLKVKEVVLHGFVLCSDGRLYHKHLSEWAMDAYARRLRDRERKRRWRDGHAGDRDGPTPPSPHPRPRDIPPTETGTTAAKDIPKPNGHADEDVPNPLTGEERTGQERRGEDSKKDFLNLKGGEGCSAREADLAPKRAGPEDEREPTVAEITARRASALAEMGEVRPLAAAMAKRMFTNYPARAAIRTAEQQSVAVSPPDPPRRPKPAYMTREQINVALRRTA